MRRGSRTALHRGLRAWLSLVVVALLAMASVRHCPGSGRRYSRTSAVSLVADRVELTVGDPIGLTLEVTHPGDHVVVMPRPGLLTGGCSR